MKPGLDDLILGWHVNGALIVVAGAGVAYAAGVSRVRAWPRWRSAAFAAGLVVLGFALCAGIEGWADRLLSVHMTQHLLLSLVAAPLLVLGAPLRLALGALSAPRARALGRVASGRAGLLVHPVVAGVAFASATLLLHVPAVYDAGVENAWLHALLHAAFLGSALLFWTPLLSPEPLAHRMSPTAKLVYLLLAMPAMALVGVVLSTASTVVYPPYATGGSALSDQALAGALMWIGGAVVIGAAFLLCGWQALVTEERRMLAREARGGRA